MHAYACLTPSEAYIQLELLNLQEMTVTKPCFLALSLSFIRLIELISSECLLQDHHAASYLSISDRYSIGSPRRVSAHNPPILQSLEPSLAGPAYQRRGRHPGSAKAPPQCHPRQCTVCLLCSASSLPARMAAILHFREHQKGIRTPFSWYLMPGAFTRRPCLSKKRPPFRIWGSPSATPDTAENGDRKLMLLLVPCRR